MDLLWLIWSQGDIIQKSNFLINLIKLSIIQ